MSSKKKVCIFCGASIKRNNKSKEHVIPRWLIDSLNFHEIKLYGKGTSFPNVPEIIFNQSSYGIYSLVLGNVCKLCNTSWMAELENNTKPLLLAVLDDRSPTILSKEQCLILSNWIYKTAITLNYQADYKKIIPMKHVKDFYLNKKVPTNVNIDLAFCREIDLHWYIGGNKKLVLLNRSKELKVLNKSYIITLQINHLLLKITWSPDSTVQILPIPVSYVIRIHPQVKEEPIIQVVKGCIFRSIEQFHFETTIFVEDGVLKKISDVKK